MDVLYIYHVVILRWQKETLSWDYNPVYMCRWTALILPPTMLGLWWVSRWQLDISLDSLLQLWWVPSRMKMLVWNLYYSYLCSRSVFQQTHEAWGQVFLLAAGIYIGCNIIFVLFGSGSVQRWNNPQEEVVEDKKREIKREMLSLIDKVIQTPFSRIWNW